MVWSESDNHGFADETDYLRSLKKGDTYTFSYEFEYIAKNHGNDNYVMSIATMHVQVDWNDSEAGYEISYEVPDMYKINSSEGNGDADSFYEHDVYWRVIEDLEALGIGSELRVT